MPKKILYESAIHQFLWAGKRLGLRLAVSAPASAESLARWLAALNFANPGQGAVLISWVGPVAGQRTLNYRDAKFYTRGDGAIHYRKQDDAGLTFHNDRVMDDNIVYFDRELRAALSASGVFDGTTLERVFVSAVIPADSVRKHAEEAFHDEWASSENIESINVRQRNEACTAPEMRHIRRRLGDLHGKTLLDVGCGLGEASVYFAMEGAVVTATDISPGMCGASQKLAAANAVALETHVSAIEDLGLGLRQFDIIYTGNTLHHADLEATLGNILPHLKPEGVFVSWDPVAYNPIINLYRVIAMKVRTEDEHPLRRRDIRAITSRFGQSEVSWYWLTSLLIFILMVAVQFRSPNKERFWKKVIDEADSWSWLYRPLAALDRGLIKLFPFLGYFCWNVVIVARSPLPVVRR